ncbi:MAG: hypothetical protein M3R67_15215 [Acidobacteriota bacterium]|nr:hypothetical protein [Acidobacteriota bacterium]
MIKYWAITVNPARTSVMARGSLNLSERTFFDDLRRSESGYMIRRWMGNEVKIFREIW